MTQVLHRLAATRVGIDARAALQTGAGGEVIAVFRRSIYLQFDSGIVCVGDETIGDGPLNLICHHARKPWYQLASIGAPVLILNDAVHVSAVSIDLGATAVWSAPDSPCIDAATLHEGFSLLSSEVRTRLPDEGLASIFLVDAFPRTAIEQQAYATGRQLVDWVRDGGRRPETVPLEAIDTLLGLGPGLTPSGDDYLAGFSLALRIFGEQHKNDVFAREISARATQRTNAISAAHLAAALHGRVRADLHLVVNAIVAADHARLVRGLEALASNDHSSPWDALAGFVVAARALFERSVRVASETPSG